MFLKNVNSLLLILCWLQVSAAGKGVLITSCDNQIGHALARQLDDLVSPVLFPANIYTHFQLYTTVYSIISVHRNVSLTFIAFFQDISTVFK